MLRQGGHSESPKSWATPAGGTWTVQDGWCSAIARSQPEPLREHTSTSSGEPSSLSISAVLPAAHTQSVCTALPRHPSAPSHLSAHRSSNTEGCIPQLTAFCQTVAGRDESIPLALISCSIAPLSQIKALSSPCLLYRWEGAEDVCNNQNDRCSGRRCNHKGTGTTDGVTKTKEKCSPVPEDPGSQGKLHKGGISNHRSLPTAESALQ